jgi:hypothetical protein
VIKGFIRELVESIAEVRIGFKKVRLGPLENDDFVANRPDPTCASIRPR